MSTEEALNILGVSASAGFDEVMDRKKALLAQAGGDSDRVLDVEAAYDVILSQRLKMRMTGENVAGGVRFADVPKVRPVAKAVSGDGGQLQLFRPDAAGSRGSLRCEGAFVMRPPGSRVTWGLHASRPWSTCVRRRSAILPGAARCEGANGARAARY
eukprot:365350-Chlamydomonas_euryale.AAC.1